MVTVIVPVTAAVLAGVADIAGVPAGAHIPPPVPEQLAGVTAIVASESWPVSATVVLTPPAVITRLAFLIPVVALLPFKTVDGLKTTVIMQLCPAPSVTPPVQ